MVVGRGAWAQAGGPQSGQVAESGSFFFFFSFSLLSFFEREASRECCNLPVFSSNAWHDAGRTGTLLQVSEMCGRSSATGTLTRCLLVSALAGS